MAMIRLIPLFLSIPKTGTEYNNRVSTHLICLKKVAESFSPKSDLARGLSKVYQELRSGSVKLPTDGDVDGGGSVVASTSSIASEMILKKEVYKVTRFLMLILDNFNKGV